MVVGEHGPVAQQEPGGPVALLPGEALALRAASPRHDGEWAALGAALQARWTARRASGEPCAADEVASAFVRTTGEDAEPDPAGVRVLREARGRLQALVARAL